MCVIGVVYILAILVIVNLNISLFFNPQIITIILDLPALFSFLFFICCCIYANVSSVGRIKVFFFYCVELKGFDVFFGFGLNQEHFWAVSPFLLTVFSCACRSS